MPLPVILIDFENVQPAALGRLQPGTTRVKVFLGQQQTKLTLELARALQPFGADAEYIQIAGSGPDAVDFHIAFYIGRLAASEPGTSFTIVSKDKGFDPLVKHLHSLGIDCRRMPDLPTPAAAAKAGSAAKPAPTPPKSLAAAAPTPTPSPAPKPAPTQAAKSATPSPAKAAVSPAAKPAPVKATPAAKAATPAVPVSAPAKSTPTSTAARVKVAMERLRKMTKPATVSKLRSSIKACFQPPLDGPADDAIVQSLTDSKKITVTGTKVAYALG